jgi:hypothetical protein
VRPEWNAIMNGNVEDLLREGMDRFTRDLQAPAGLTYRVARLRRRRLAQRSLAGAAAALAAGAVALVTVVIPEALHGRAGSPVVDAAYVVKRVSSALTAAEPGDIAHIAITRTAATPFGGKPTTTTAEEWSYGDLWRSITYSSAGHPVYDEGFSASSVFTVVSYLTRSWARAPGLGRPNATIFEIVPLGTVHPEANQVVSLRACGPVIAAVSLLFQPGLPGFGFAASSLPAARALRNAISCGTLAVAGHRHVDGIEAIELTSRWYSPISETIWVTPGTYLPVRVVVRSAAGAPFLRQTANITWLQPTAQNKADLAVPIPAGFHQVTFFPLGHALLPILRLIAGMPITPRIFCLGPVGPTCKNKTIGTGFFGGLP